MASRRSSTNFGAFVWTAIRKHPLLFNGASGGILCASSDAMAQEYEERHRRRRDKELVVVKEEMDSDIRQEKHRRSPPPSSSSPPTYLAPSLASGLTLTVPPTPPPPPLTPPLSSFAVSSSFDWMRFGAAGVIGVVLGGVVYPGAYAQLDAIWKGTSMATAVKKSVLEIFTVGIFVNTLSMTCRGLFRGDRAPTQVAEHVVHELPTVTRNDVLVWLPYNLVAFSVIPTIVRPATTAIMEASWQGYISWRSHDIEATEEEQEDQ